MEDDVSSLQVGTNGPGGSADGARTGQPRGRWGRCAESNPGCGNGVKTSLTKFQLVTALMSGGPLRTSTADFRIVNGVTREDGSNQSWLVTGIVGREGQSYVETVHVRTID